VTTGLAALPRMAAAMLGLAGCRGGSTQQIGASNGRLDRQFRGAMEQNRSLIAQM
jgi:hypothetical protein